MSIVPEIILFDVIGLPIRDDDILLIPARFDFCGDSEGTAEHPVAKFAPDLTRMRSLFNCFGMHEESLLHYWLRARIPAAFGFRPAIIGRNQDRDDLLDFPFVAVFLSESDAILTAIPFVCAEGYDGPGLIFPKSCSSIPAKQRVAEAFWHVLLDSPERIAPFEEWMYDEQSGLLKVYADRGLLCICDLEDNEDGRGRYDPHLVPFVGEMFSCPDCGGSGVEDSFLSTEDCVTCNGKGSVSWCESRAEPTAAPDVRR